MVDGRNEERSIKYTKHKYVEEEEETKRSGLSQLDTLECLIID